MFVEDEVKFKYITPKNVLSLNLKMMMMMMAVELVDKEEIPHLFVCLYL